MQFLIADMSLSSKSQISHQRALALSSPTVLPAKTKRLLMISWRTRHGCKHFVGDDVPTASSVSKRDSKRRAARIRPLLVSHSSWHPQTCHVFASLLLQTTTEIEPFSTCWAKLTPARQHADLLQAVAPTSSSECLLSCDLRNCQIDRWLRWT